MEITQLAYDGKQYIVGYIGNKLCIEKTNEDNSFIRNWYKVVDDSEYSYKIQRTQIRAINGAKGLFKHFKRCIDEKFAIECWVVDPLENILKTVKPLH